MQRSGLGQPDVPINAGPFIEPTVPEAGINPHDNKVLASGEHEVRDVETKRDISIIVATDEAAIDKHTSVAKDTVEFEHDTAPGVRRRYLETAPIPTDRCLRITLAERLVPVAPQPLVVYER